MYNFVHYKSLLKNSVILIKTDMSKAHFSILLAVIVGIVVTLYSYYYKPKFYTNNQLMYSYLPQERFLELCDESNALVNHYLNDDDKSNDAASEIEALGSLKAAMDLHLQGRVERALKLFQHAVALAPRHPDVLNGYGEFLEKSKKDVVKADQLYFQALTYSPNHNDAVSNRQRTASIVAEIDNSRFQNIDRKRDALAAIPESNGSLRRAKKEAYFSYIYHTVAIEGNTMTLQQTRSVLETRMAVMGKSIDEHNEILGLDSAMKYINASLLNRMGDDITVHDILEIHRRVLGHVDPVEGGSMRRGRVYVGGHVPPGPASLAGLMAQFAQWLNNPTASTAAEEDGNSGGSMHPVRFAALAHYKLVHIHPFADGNGRTSRLLMNLILMQAGYPPVIILKQHRQHYYETLRLANEGDVRPFVRFIAECTENTLDLFLWATSEFAHEVPALAPRRHAGGGGGGRSEYGEEDEEGRRTDGVREEDGSSKGNEEREEGGKGRESGKDGEDRGGSDDGIRSRESDDRSEEGGNGRESDEERDGGRRRESGKDGEVRGDDGIGRRESDKYEDGGSSIRERDGDRKGNEERDGEGRTADKDGSCGTGVNGKVGDALEDGSCGEERMMILEHDVDVDEGKAAYRSQDETFTNG